MGRRKRYTDPSGAFHITNRSNNKEFFPLPLIDVWEIFCRTLRVLNLDFKIEIHAFVLMANHYHLIMSTINGSTSEPVRYLQTEVSKAINRKADRINHNFGGPYNPTYLSDPSSYAYVYKYVLRNPVRAGISGRVETYPYSTAYLDLDHVRLPYTENFPRLWKFVLKDIESRLTWLNRRTPKEDEEVIARGLKRAEFSLPKSRNDGPRVRRILENY